MTTIKIKAVEVIQSVQDFNHNKDKEKEDDNIPLIQDKVTYIRFYLCSENEIPVDINASLNIKYKQKDQDFTFLKTIKSVETSTILNEDLSGEIQIRRLDWDKSLNFKLPKNFLSDQQENIDESVELKFLLDKVIAVHTDESESSKDRKITLETDPKNEQLYQYINGYKFERIGASLRVVAYRYTDVETGEVYEPTSGELNVIKRYIESAFPISKLNWSTVTIDAPREFNQLYNILERRERSDEHVDRVYTMLFQHLLAIRNQDISFRSDIEVKPGDKSEENNVPLWDEKTLYLGVLSDPNGQIIGSAMDSPKFVTPHVVAFTGALPYGETAAHELAHMLGRAHPGIPDQKTHGKYLGQDDQTGSEDAADQNSVNNTSPLGYLSGNDSEKNIAVGMDTQSPLSQPLLLAGNEYFDLMTYRFPKWVSRKTYKGLFKRLQDIQELESKNSEKFYWNVIGEYNFLKNSARINYVLKSKFEISQPDPKAEDESRGSDKVAQQFILRIKQTPSVDNITEEDQGERVYLRRNLEKSGNSSYIGVFQHTLTTTVSKKQEHNPPQRIELEINGHKVDVVMPLGNINKNIKDEAAKLIKIDINQIKNIDVNPEVRNPSKNVDIRGQQIKASRNDKHNLALCYSVDKNGYYLRFNWSPLEDQSNDQNSSKIEMPDVIKALFKSEQLQLPVTTTIQVKDTSGKNSENADKWQTVAITNRLKEEFWISHELLVKKSKDHSNHGHHSPNLDVRNVRDLFGSYSTLGIYLRVCISIQGKRIEIFNSKSGYTIKGLNINPVVDIESLGNKGYNNSNYYLGYRSNVESDSDNQNKKVFYRPNVR